MRPPSPGVQGFDVSSSSSRGRQEQDFWDTLTAGVLAWLIPGAGHWFQGRRHKAVLFFWTITGLFVFGMVLGQGRVVYAKWHPRQERRFIYLCQIGVGLPSLPALVAARRAAAEKQTLIGNLKWYMPPDRAELNQLYHTLNRRFELGTLFTAIAGLLNLLVIYDVLAGPAYGDRPPPPEARGNPAGAGKKPEQAKEGSGQQ